MELQGEEVQAKWSTANGYNLVYNPPVVVPQQEEILAITNVSEEVFENTVADLKALLQSSEEKNTNLEKQLDAERSAIVEKSNELEKLALKVNSIERRHQAGEVVSITAAPFLPFASAATVETASTMPPSTRSRESTWSMPFSQCCSVQSSNHHSAYYNEQPAFSEEVGTLISQNIHIDIQRVPGIFIVGGGASESAAC
jgi:hypothetical protein